VADLPASILLVEDDPDVSEMLSAYFRVLGYEVMPVFAGEDALAASRSKKLDLILLDIRLPDIDGYEVAHRLRENRRTADIPILFLTEKRGRSDRMRGLELGADDYITKPFDIQELRLRVRNAIRRSAQGPLTNPVTGLPEIGLVEERLRECLERENWSALLISLENLEQFRETYGFVASDDVLRAVGLMIQNAVRELGNPHDFVGQLGPVEFILVTGPGRAAAMQRRLHARLSQALDYFYPIKDRLNLRSGTRLAIHLRQLSGHEGPFPDLENLKSSLRGTL